MKLPQTPPDSSEFWRSTIDRQIIDIIDIADSPLVEGKYLHWDQLVHRKPPHDASHEDWWFSLKLKRSGLMKQVPLLGVDGRPFNYLLADPIPERLHTIDLGAGGLIEMADQITNPDTRDRYYVSSLIEEAITSSQLEGAATTRQVAKEMLRAGRKPKDRSERMILNNYRTMRQIRKLKDRKLTKELVFELHKLVTDGTLNDPTAAGRFRRAIPEQAIVVGEHDGTVYHTPPSAEDLEERMRTMCDFANERIPSGFIHPVIRSIMLHFWLAYDHPFVDGNGRTARALFYWSMLRNKFWLFEFMSISQIILKGPSRYYRAFLYSETDDNDLTYFILYHLDVINRAIKSLHDYIKRKTEQLRVVDQELRNVTLLNHRQRALVAHALRHPSFVYTIKSHCASHNVTYQTARTDLLGLVEKGLFSAGKSKKTWYFRSVEDLASQVTELR